MLPRFRYTNQNRGPQSLLRHEAAIAEQPLVETRTPEPDSEAGCEATCTNHSVCAAVVESVEALPGATEVSYTHIQNEEIVLHGVNNLALQEGRLYLFWPALRC